ncbi:hypothetical protein EVAR_29557_1 [Eumeta japonica]|uniref:DUF659 domain-containing protein n=1 Tax=Eumeta variegata TaxID=151549 RepID=A0A4C2A2X9_EUMVA|nr:hypothetical protein EVAR_29557_1 [Eumeta japonica]
MGKDEIPFGIGRLWLATLGTYCQGASNALTDGAAAASAEIRTITNVSDRVFCTSEDMKNLFAAKGNNYKLPSSPNTIELIVMNYGMTLKMKMKEDLLKLKNEDYRFTVILDEWTSGINQRFLNVNVHTVINCQPTYWNIGLARIFGSMSSESCVQVLKEKLSEFDLSLDKDIVGITTDGASVMKKTVQSNPEEEFEDPELNTNRSAEEKEVLGDNPDNYDGNLKTPLSEKLVSSMNNRISERRIKATAVLLYLKNPNIYQDYLEQWKEDLSLRAIAAQNYTSLQEELEETLRASKTESPFKPSGGTRLGADVSLQTVQDVWPRPSSGLTGRHKFKVKNWSGNVVEQLESKINSQDIHPVGGRCGARVCAGLSPCAACDDHRRTALSRSEKLVTTVCERK